MILLMIKVMGTLLHTLILNELKPPCKNQIKQLLCAILGVIQLFVNVFNGGF